MTTVVFVRGVPQSVPPLDISLAPEQSWELRVIVWSGMDLVSPRMDLEPWTLDHGPWTRSGIGLVSPRAQ